MTILTVEQAKSYAQQAGFTGDALNTIVAISQAESGLDTNRIGPVGEVGIVQIYLSAHPTVTRTCATDPLCSYQAAYKISQGGTNFRAWCTAWSDKLCGTRGGTYLGANSPFQQFMKGVSSATTSPQSSSSTVDTTGFIQSLNSWVAEIGVFILALVVIVLGIILLSSNVAKDVVKT